MINKLTFEDLLDTFIKKGGTVNKHYLQPSNKNKQALVYLNGWHKGNNIRNAILKALEPQY